MPGPTARPGSGRPLIIIASLVVAQNVRHGLFLSRCQPGANAP